MKKREKRKSKEEKIIIELDNYNEIFSDFDPRPFAERSLSDDFLSEVKKASIYKDGTPNLNLIIPIKERIANAEGIIKKRLTNHFKEHNELLNKETLYIVRKGVIFVVIGLILMITGALIIFKNVFGGTFLNALLVVILEPAGWFFFWEGLRQIVFYPEENKSELKFYNKMSKANIEFTSG